MSKKVLAWHIIKNDKLLGYDLSNKKVKKGSKFTVNKDKLKLCEYGLHASKRLIDALEYAPGNIVCRVELSGKIIEGEDKLVASCRKVLWMVDATEVFHLFACKVATQALLAERKAGREPDSRSFAAIQAKKDYLKGNITKEELENAYNAAYSAACSAVYSAAYNAAFSAAFSTVYSSASFDAACNVACRAAYSAACSVACSAEYSAVRNKQNKLLTKMVMEVRKSAHNK